MTGKITALEASEQLDRVLGFFARAEAKASAILAIDLGILGVCAVNTKWQNFCDLAVFIEGVGLLVLLGTSLWFAYWTHFPELRESVSSLVYFGDIAKMERDAYVKRITEMSHDEYMKQLYTQVWRNSEIVSSKFAYVKYAFWATAAAMPVWVLYLMTVATLNMQFVLP